MFRVNIKRRWVVILMKWFSGKLQKIGAKSEGKRRGREGKARWAAHHFKVGKLHHVYIVHVGSMYHFTDCDPIAWWLIHKTSVTKTSQFSPSQCVSHSYIKKDNVDCIVYCWVGWNVYWGWKLITRQTGYRISSSPPLDHFSLRASCVRILAR